MIRDVMKNKIVLITGATDGIGRQTAFGLARLGGLVIVHARNGQRGEAAMRELKTLLPDGKFELVICDLSVFSQVRKMAAEINRKYNSIDILINNAGIYADTRSISADGIEMTFQVNHLSHFLLTNLVLENILESKRGRIINVSSMTHQSAQLDLNNLQGEKYYDGYNAYSCSKLENILFTLHLAKYLEGKNVTVNALHPGVVNTKLLHQAMGSRSLGSSSEKGAITGLYLASSLEVENVTGKYFVNCKPQMPSQHALDVKLQSTIWEISESLTNKP